MSANKLTESSNMYWRAFDTYHRHSDRFQVTCNWIDTQLRPVINSLNFTGDDVTRVLSIGPGKGDSEDEILKAIRDRNKTVHPVQATIVEPSTYMVEEYQKRVVTQGTQLHDISYDWRTETVNAFLENGGNDGGKFHFINAMHSVYYFEDLPGTLRDLYNLLEPGGMMQITAVTEEHGAQMTKKDHRPITTSREVQEACRMKNIPISHEFVIQERVDITSCFESPEDMTEVGRLLLDFFTHVTDFTKTALHETLQETLRLFKSDQFSEKKDGKILLKGDWNSFISIR